jgi:phospholipase C
MQRFLVASFIAAVLAGSVFRGTGTQGGEPASDTGPLPRTETQPGNKLRNIDHWIVIYQENWSFDGLYGKFPGADGLNRAAAATAQVDKQGKPLAALPSPSTDPNIPPGLPVGPYDLSQYVPVASTTKDLVHAFYTEQLQIDNGRLEPSTGSMDKFVAWSNNGNLVQSYYDASSLPVGLLARQYTLCDHYFHAAFGGSFLNHQFLVAAAAPPWNQPLPKSSKKFVSHFDAATKTLTDGNLSMDGRYAVNTTYAAQAPHPGTPYDQLLQPINNVDPRRPGYRPTIGNRLDDAGVSWKWYSGGWDDALAGKPGILFAYHHQPLAYYAKYAPLRPDGTLNPATTGRAAHLQDEQRFFVDLAAGQLPAVSFIKPYGRDNEHPGYASVLRGQQHVADIVHAVQNSADWSHTAIIITYDENGGRWDHVPPPPRDAWGPGTRVPAIVISPFAKQAVVCHTSYNTLSILKTIETRYTLKPLCERDAGAASMADCFQAEAHPSLVMAYLQPDADDPSRSALIVGGTPRADKIDVSLHGGSMVVELSSEGGKNPLQWKFDAAKISRIEVYGRGGDDQIRIDPAVTLPVVLLAGRGRSTFFAGEGPCIAVFGDGGKVEKRTGRNIVIGPPNNGRRDVSPDELRIGRPFDFDADVGSLRAFLAEWARPNLTRRERLEHLTGKTPGGANGAAVINPKAIASPSP